MAEEKATIIRIMMPEAARDQIAQITNVFIPSEITAGAVPALIEALKEANQRLLDAESVDPQLRAQLIDLVVGHSMVLKRSVAFRQINPNEPLPTAQRATFAAGRAFQVRAMGTLNGRA